MKHFTPKRKDFYLFIATVLLLAVLVIVGVSSHRRLSCVAMVNGYCIEHGQLDSEVAIQRRFYAAQQDIPEIAVLEGDALDSLIDRRLIEKYALSSSIVINEEAINSYYQARIAAYGSEQTFLDELQRLYGIGKDKYLANVAYELLREAVQANLSQPLSQWLVDTRADSEITIRLNR
jgi:hypothetical protein